MCVPRRRTRRLVRGVAESACLSRAQVSVVNSIATIKGGTHVNYITDQITQKVVADLSKKNKARWARERACARVRVRLTCVRVRAHAATTGRR